MAFDTIQALISKFEDQGQLVRIGEELSPHLEITEVTDRVVKQDGPALLFERPEGYHIPVLTNTYGTLERVRSIFDIKELDDLGERFTQLLNLDPPKGWIEKLKLLPKLKEAADVFPRLVKSGPCQGVVQTEGFDLRQLPVLTCLP